MTETTQPAIAVEPAWLQDVLRKAGHEDARVIAVDVEALLESGAWCELARLTIKYEAGSTDAPSTLIAKLPREGEVKPVGIGLGLYERERRFFSELAGHISFPTPGCLHPGDGDAGEEPLLLEDLGDRRMGDQIAGLALADAERLIDEAAVLHAAFWESSELERFPWLLRLDDSMNVTIMEQVAQGGIEGLQRVFADRVDAPLLEQAVGVARRFGDVLRATSSGPMTLAHGDLRLDNVFFDHEGAPTAVDWQTVARTRGTHDVAYLLTGSVSEEALADQWESLLRRYHSALVAGGVESYSWDQCLEHYRQNVCYSLLPPLALLGSIAIDSDQGRALAEALTLRALRHASDVAAFETV